MEKEPPYSIPKWSWWHNPKSKRLFVITDKWHTGLGETFKLESIDLLEVGKGNPVQITPEDFRALVTKGELALLPVKIEGPYNVSFI